MKSKFQLGSKLLQIAGVPKRKRSKLAVIQAAILFAAMRAVFAQPGPIVKIVDLRLDGGLTVHYSIDNPSPVPLFIYSRFLSPPLVGIFDRKSHLDTIWLTFPPEQKGNWEESLETIELPAGSSYSGRFSDPVIGDQLRACGNGSAVSLKLVIGWSREHLRDHRSKSLGFVDAIAEVGSWQTLAASSPVMIRPPTKMRRKKCVADPVEEVWR